MIYALLFVPPLLVYLGLGDRLSYAQILLLSLVWGMILGHFIRS